jgi:hypothetical protein
MVFLPSLPKLQLLSFDSVIHISMMDRILPPVDAREIVDGTNGSRDIGRSRAVDQLFDLLCAMRRRFVLYYLNDVEAEVVPLAELVTYVRDRSTRAAQVPTDRGPIRLALEHVHLPKLEKAGLIEYDPRNETVRGRLHPPFPTIIAHVQALESTRPRDGVSQREAHDG